mmetsp:Transcript_60214/g.175964  ORF Transcript_60214/g.175964 Transcript_60214/m.175964 type:complete len:292 (+) Transcript_60214:124-999(+)
MSVKPQRADMSNGAHGVFRKQFYKTEMCRYYATGCAKGPNCPYAHGEDELRTAPDLIKTSLCQAWASHSCPLTAEDCPFAHGWSEKRVTSTFLKHGVRQSETTNGSRKRRSAKRMPAESEAVAETLEAPPVLAQAKAAEASPASSPERHSPCMPRHGCAPPAVEVPAPGAENLLGTGIAALSSAPLPQLGQVFIVCPVVVGVIHQVQPAMGMATSPGAQAPQRAMPLVPPTADVAARVGTKVPSWGNARAETSVPGPGEHVGVALPEELRAAHSQVLAGMLQQAMPDHYED